MSLMNNCFLFAVIQMFCCNDYNTTANDSSATILSTEKIYEGKYSHNAFTDLVFFKNTFYCVFREAKSHVGDNGTIVILTSKNAKTWQVLKKIKIEQIDLRDPKFILSEKKQTLYLQIAGSVYNEGKYVKTKHFVLKTKNGKIWSNLELVNVSKKWLWKPIIYGDSSIAIGYRAGEKLSLYKSEDLKNYVKSKDLSLDPKGVLSEAACTFDGKGNLFTIIRKNYPGTYFGTSQKPFLDWDWKKLDNVIGGPNIMVINNRIIISGRTYDNSKSKNCRTKTFLGEVVGDKIKILHYLKSGGDTGYTGMVYKKGILYLSYYSEDEKCHNPNNTKTSIYLSKIKL